MGTYIFSNSTASPFACSSNNLQKADRQSYSPLRRYCARPTSSDVLGSRVLLKLFRALGEPPVLRLGPRTYVKASDLPLAKAFGWTRVVEEDSLFVQEVSLSVVLITKL